MLRKERHTGGGTGDGVGEDRTRQVRSKAVDARVTLLHACQPEEPLSDFRTRTGPRGDRISGRGLRENVPRKLAPATTPGFPMAVAPSQANGGDDWPLPAIDDVDLLVRSEASPECRRLCLAARDSIRSLSSLVSQTIEPDRICFLVDGVLLATLIPRGDSLQLRVGEEGGPAFEIQDDESFNASLNATFSHYFSRFAVRA